MSEYPTYETVGGQASEAITTARLCEHLRLAAECAMVIGHLKKANDEELLGQGWLAIAQMLELTTKNVTSLATRGRLIQ
jgi:hypothetical protein